MLKRFWAISANPTSAIVSHDRVCISYRKKADSFADFLAAAVHQESPDTRNFHAHVRVKQLRNLHTSNFLSTALYFQNRPVLFQDRKQRTKSYTIEKFYEFNGITYGECDTI